MFSILSYDFIYQYKDKPTPMSNYGLGEFTYKRTYSRLKDDGNYEEWYETIERIVNGVFRIKRNHYINNNIDWNEDNERLLAEKMYDKMFNVKFLPGGRSLWAMGTKITDEKELYTALNNCAGISTKYHKENPGFPFEFLFDACMLGVGVGFDTKGTDIPLYKPINEEEEYVIEDSREGWVNALHKLLIAYFEPNNKRVKFNYEKIRPAGQILKTFGGTSSGYEPLKKSFDLIVELLDKAINEGKTHLTSRLIVDIMNIICLAVISGNVRRSATIAVGPYDDEEFINLKNYELNPERGQWGWLSNNSIDARIGMDYSKVAEGIRLNGEPGLIWLDNAKKYSRMNGIVDNKDKDAVLFNPCTSWGTQLLTDKGYITIGEHVGEIVNVWNGEKWTPAEVKLTGHNQELFKCIFSDGSMLECTPNHKFILEDGTRKELKDLLFTDKLKRCNCQLINTGELNLDYAYDKGYELKEVPLFNYNLNSRINYLSGVIDNIGNYRDKEKNNIKYHYIKIKNNNYEYIYNIKLLLNTLGITCNLLNKTDYYKITINNENTNKLKELGLNCKKFIISNNNYKNDYYPLTLKSKEFKEKAESVYCITTLDDSHAGVFNGILTGNCGEQTLHDGELCNLVEIFINRSDNYEDFMDTLQYAFMYGKLVSLCGTQWEITNKIIEKNRRIGCSLTGITNFLQDKGIDQLKKYTTTGYDYLKKYDVELSKTLKVNESIKITCIKPSGTISLLVPGTCPGIHYPLNNYYIRRVRVNINHKKLIESMIAKNYKVEKSITEPNTMIINFPIDCKMNRCINDVSMWEQLELAACLSEWWTDNQVSCTVMFDPRTEGYDIAHALDFYQYRLKGISFLPTFKKLKVIDNPKIQKYPQPPYEEITKEKYEELVKEIKYGNINIDKNEQEEEMYCTTDTCFLRTNRNFKSNIIFMNGLPGSGKSFVAEQLKNYILNKNYSCTIISKDNFRYINGEYIFDREFEKVVEEKYFDKLQNELNKGWNFIILDNTHIGNDFVNKTLQYVVGHPMTMISIKPYDNLDIHMEKNIHMDLKDRGRLKYQLENWKLNYPLYDLHKILYEHNTYFDDKTLNKIMEETFNFFF